MGYVRVTGGATGPQVSEVRGPDLLVSQANSAGSIPVTRSAYLQVSNTAADLLAALDLALAQLPAPLI
jgi:hypothetical protein